MPAPLFVGLDAGGTKTAALAASGDTSHPLRGPGAQFLRDGLDRTVETLAALVGEAQALFEDAPLGGVAVGLAGAGRAEAREAVADALRQRLGAAPVAVAHDAEIALEAAFGADSGAILLVGTGSVAFARTDDGRTLRAGGWGSALGDDGSGAALGRVALRAVLAAFDGGPPTALVDLAAERFGLDGPDAVIEAVYTDRRPLAAFCPLLLAAAEADDWAASAALARETNALAQQVGWLATAAGDTVAHQLAYAGGLSAEPVYARSLEAALERHLPGWALQRTETAPVEGALALARRLAG